MYGEVIYNPLMNAYRCHVCGKWYRSLGYHVKAHGLKLSEYKKKFGLDKNAVLEVNELTRKRAINAIENGTSENVEQGGVQHRFKKGEQSSRRFYKRSAQTKKKLRNNIKNAK